MQLLQVSFAGPPIDDEEILARCPPELADILRQVNGCVQFDGGLHLRGACRQPAWHSLRDAWDSGNALHRLYADVHPDDVPFAEDCMGDQFLLRADQVWKLSAETGEMEPLDLSLLDWLEAVQADAVEVLSLEPLLQFQQEGGKLEPGQLLSAIPPFCLESDQELSLRAIPSADRRQFLAHLAEQLRNLPEGAQIKFDISGGDDE